MDDSLLPTALRRGWTTGACATAAAKAAFEALLTGGFPDPVTIALPSGAQVAFTLAVSNSGADWTRAGVIKDAGDDPDVTHGAMVLATVRRGSKGEGVMFRAGVGVGTVTRPGLALAVGEPAINPVPRAMMRAAIGEVAAAHGVPSDLVIEIAIPDGEALAARTLNGRLGIVGGLSILGTTGIVVPYSCAAWIDTIHRGIDVARALGLDHVAGGTGATSEATVKAFYGLPDPAIIDMGDFVGGMLKYLRRHPVERVTIAGGLAKMTKLGQGLLDLHSKRGAVDREWLAKKSEEVGGNEAFLNVIRNVNTGAQAFELAAEAGIDLSGAVARAAYRTAATCLGRSDGLDIILVDRSGAVIARAAQDVGPAPPR